MNIKFSYIFEPYAPFSGLHLHIDDFALQVTSETKKVLVIESLDDIIKQLQDIKDEINENY
jgi:hypothetical protein